MTVTTRRLAGVGATVLCLTLWTGCTPSEPGPSSTPTAPISPTVPITTPTPSSTPTESDVERDMRLDFEAAEKSYRTFFNEFHRILRAGGAKDATKKFKSVTGGSIEDEGTAIIRAYRKREWREVGKVKILSAKSDLYKTGSVTLVTCEDERGVYDVDASGKVVTDEGGLRRLEVSVKNIGESWLVWSAQDKTVKTVEKCVS